MPATQRLRENKYNQFDIYNKRFILNFRNYFKDRTSETQWLRFLTPILIASHANGLAATRDAFSHGIEALLYFFFFTRSGFNDFVCVTAEPSLNRCAYSLSIDRIEN
jgi:hypothetical protein